MSRLKRECCVPYCNSGVHTFKYTFPEWKDDIASQTRALRWIRRSGNIELLNFHPSAFYNKFYMCDIHFDEKQYVDPQRRKRTKRNAEPVFNVDQCISSQAMEMYKRRHMISNEVKIEEYPSDEETDTASDGEIINDNNDDILPSKRFKPNLIVAEARSVNHDHAYVVNVTRHDHDYLTVNIETDSTDTASEDGTLFQEGGTGNQSEEPLCTNHSVPTTFEDRDITSSDPSGISCRISKRCFVLNCSHNNTDSSMYSFPKVWTIEDGKRVHDETNFRICLFWIKVCGNKKAYNVEDMHKKFVCSNHFENSDFLGRQRLKREAVPSQNLPPSLTDFDMSLFQTNGINVVQNNNEIIDDSLNSRLHDPNSRILGLKFESQMRELEWHTCDICNEKFLFRNGLNMNKIHRNRRVCKKFSKDNLMHPGNVPVELQDLSFVEEQLIARVHPVVSVYKLKGCQYGYSGNVINFSQDVSQFASQLPHRIEDISSIITVKFENVRKEVIDFKVRAKKVFDALKWLKENNKHYEFIEISNENLDLLPEDGNVFDQIVNMDLGEIIANEESDVTAMNESSEEFFETIHSTGVPQNNIMNQDTQLKTVFNWPSMSTNPINEFMPSFIMCAFPTLFPYGDCDLMEENRQQKIKLHEYMKHFMNFHDQRFAQHKTFRFFAFNMWMRHSAISDGNVYVKKNTAVAQMNIQELEEYMQQNPSELHKLMFIGSNLRGSKAYWSKCCGELKSMVEQIGLPTFFLTLSAADLYWPDLFRLLCGKDINSIPMSERHRLLQSNPMIVDTFFKYRIDCYIENVLEPLYQVKDFWYRIEYQHRGSPHMHGLFWLNDAPEISNYHTMSNLQKEEVLNFYDKLASAIIPDNDCPYPDQHPSEIFFKDVIDESLDLSQLLKKVQFHTKCQKGYCLKKNPANKQLECRFKFPKDINSQAELKENEEANAVEFIPERNHPRLNKFNPFIIQTWRANIDIAPVVSKRAILEYIAKYITKNETQSSSLTDICKAVCSSLPSHDKAKRAIHRLLNKNCVERDISAQEVCHILMGHKLHSASGRNFVIVNTNNKNLDWTPVDDTKVGKSILEKYCDRPEHLEHITLWQAAKYYNCSRWSKLRKKCNIVRVFPKFNLGEDEDKNEMFYRQQVLLHANWRREGDFNINDESWKTIHQSLHSHNREEIDLGVLPTLSDDEDIEENENNDNVNNEDWMIVSRLHNVVSGETVEAGNREIDINYDWSLASKNYEQYGDLNYFVNYIDNEKKTHNVTVEEDLLPDVDFSEDQEKVRVIMNKQIHYIKFPDDNNAPPKRIIVQGKAGSGKSLLIKYLTSTLRKEFGADSYLLLGPTGVAAVNIGGSTIHSKLIIPTKRCNFKCLTGESARKLCDVCRNVKFIIIDEYSMIGCAMLAMIDQRCREGTGKADDFFGSLNIYLFGDIRQLPPVFDTALYSDISVNDPSVQLKQNGKIALNSFEAHCVLKKCFRQNDNNFKELLDRLSVGEITQEDYLLLRRRFVTNVSANEIKKFDDALHLNAKSEDVNDANTTKIEQLTDSSGNLVPIARIPAINNGRDAHKLIDAEGLFNTLKLGKGVRVMLKSNLWTEKGLVNGALGVVEDILYKENKHPHHDPPSIVMVKFDNYSGPGIGPKCLVPIPTILRSWSNTGGNCSRQQFPLVPAYSCTIHKSQGLTLDKAVVDIGAKEFALGLSYVGLSRVKTIDGLLLVPFDLKRVTDDIKGKSEFKDRILFEKRFEEK